MRVWLVAIVDLTRDFVIWLVSFVHMTRKDSKGGPDCQTWSDWPEFSSQCIEELIEGLSRNQLILLMEVYNCKVILLFILFEFLCKQRYIYATH